MTSSGWLPAWWDFSEPPPRRPVPEGLEPAALSAEVRDSLPLLHAEMTATLAAFDEARDSLSGFWVVSPEPEEGSWLGVGADQHSISVSGSLLFGDRYLSRSEMNALADIGFEAELDRELAVCNIMLDERDPHDGWRLAGTVAAAAYDRVYKQGHRLTGPIRWTLVRT